MVNKLSKYTAKDCDVMIGITNPYSFELPEYLGYDIKILKSNFRCMEIVLNRSGQSNGLCPLYFDGAINYFKELPLPNSDKIKEVYEKVRNKALVFFISKKKEKQSLIKTLSKKWQKLWQF